MATFTELAVDLWDLKNQIHGAAWEILGNEWGDFRHVFYIEGLVNTDGESTFWTPEELKLVALIERYEASGDFPDIVEKLYAVKDKFFPEGNWPLRGD